jgi:hypothetical protein
MSRARRIDTGVLSLSTPGVYFGDVAEARSWAREVNEFCALLLGIALVKPRAHYVVPAALAYSLFAVPHFFYHLMNREMAGPGQQVFLTVGNAVVALLGLAPIPLVLSRRSSPAPR